MNNKTLVVFTLAFSAACTAFGQFDRTQGFQLPKYQRDTTANRNLGDSGNNARVGGRIITPVATNLENDRQTMAVPGVRSQEDEGLLPEERVSIGVYEKCNQSVVHITTKVTSMDSFLQVSTHEGSGSGSVLNKDGLILTNYHVIEGAREISVRINGTSYPATSLGEDEATDIAVLRIDAPPEELIPLEWGDSSKLRVGQRVYAIGNPFGLERSMSAGMIASLNRQIPSAKSREMGSLIQVDASINRGNSGGPLLNTRGQIVGMNTAIMSSDGDSSGVAFAIPVSTIARIVPQLVSNGFVIRPSIGISRVYENEKGLLIVSVQPGGPADKAGLQGFSLVTKTYRQGLYSYQKSSIDTSKADLIVAIDGRAITTADELLDYVASRKPGDQVILTVFRQNQRSNVSITLGQLR